MNIAEVRVCGIVIVGKSRVFLFQGSTGGWVRVAAVNEELRKQKCYHTTNSLGKC